MSKSKGPSKSAKPAKADVLTKVKDAVVTKPVQQIKAKGNQIAKAVAGTEGKQSKKSKKAREPTPESSEDESASSESSSSESENEEEAKPAANGKANGTKKAAAAPESDDDSADDVDSDDASSDEETPTTNGKAKASAVSKATKPQDSDDSDDASSEGSGDESEAEAKPAGKGVAKAQEESDDDEAGSSDSDSSDDDDEVTSKPTKRKAEEEVQPAAKKPKTVDGDAPQSGNLFVGNLSWNINEEWLREEFEAFGEVSRVQIMTDRESGRSKGFGYVEFANHEDAAKAHAAKNGSDLDGRTLNVDFANSRPNTQDRQDNRRKSYGDQLGEASDTLFVGNLSFDVGQEAVTEAFAPHGTILGIRLPTDRETGQAKGFGYVTFSSLDEAGAALEAMQGAYIANRPIRLDYSQPRPQNSDSPGRGRGGFGGRGGRGGGRGDRGGFGGRGGRGGRGDRGGRGGFGGFGGRGGRGAPRGNTTNRGGFGDFSGKKFSFE